MTVRTNRHPLPGNLPFQPRIEVAQVALAQPQRHNRIFEAAEGQRHVQFVRIVARWALILSVDRFLEFPMNQTENRQGQDGRMEILTNRSWRLAGKILAFQKVLEHRIIRLTPPPFSIPLWKIGRRKALGR